MFVFVIIAEYTDMVRKNSKNLEKNDKVQKLVTSNKKISKYIQVDPKLQILLHKTIAGLKGRKSKFDISRRNNKIKANFKVNFFKVS